MGRIAEALRRFMYGRYGSDGLNNTIFWLYVAVILLNTFINSPVLYLLSLVVFFIYMFRTMSRNIARRSEENRRFIAFKNKIVTLFGGKRYSSDGTHVFRICKHCGARLRLPRKSGKHLVRCPKCGKTFDVRILF